MKINSEAPAPYFTEKADDDSVIEQAIKIIQSKLKTPGMALTDSKSVPAASPDPSHNQQSVVCGYLISDGFTEQFVKTLSDENRRIAKRFNWDVIALCRCPSHESEQGGKHGL